MAFYCLQTDFNSGYFFVLYEVLRLIFLIMVLLRHTKWLYAAAAGGGIAIGLYNFLEPEKKCVQMKMDTNKWKTNFEPSVKWDYNWDKRDFLSAVKPAKNTDDPLEQNRINEEQETRKPKATRHLILIRHGQYEESFKDDKDRKLTTLGRKQAEYVGQRLKDLGFNYTKLTRSTMTRAIETSDIILKYLNDNIPTDKDDMLREGCPILPEPPTSSSRVESDRYLRDSERIKAAFEKYFHRASPSQKSNSYEILVCHANVIRFFVCKALQFPPEGWLRLGLHHCSITWIVIPPSGRVSLYALGDFGFLPREAMSV